MMDLYIFEENMELKALRDSTYGFKVVVTKGQIYRIVECSVIGNDWIVIINDSGKKHLFENATSLLGDLFTVVGINGGITTHEVY